MPASYSAHMSATRAAHVSTCSAVPATQPTQSSAAMTLKGGRTGRVVERGKARLAFRLSFTRFDDKSAGKGH